MAPTTTGPVLIPIRMRKSTPWTRWTSAPSGSSPSWMASAARSARAVVLVGDRRAEERHHAVTEELVDRSLVAVDRARGSPRRHGP